MRTGNRRPETEESERNEMIISDISSEETKMQTEGIESCGLFANGGKSCRLCPLECGVNRAEHAGVCGVGGFAIWVAFFARIWTSANLQRAL